MANGNLTKEELDKLAKDVLADGVGDFLSIAVFYPILVSTCGVNGLHNWSIPFLISFGIAVLAMALLAVFYREKKED